MRVLVTGGRTYTDAVKVADTLERFEISELCSGHAAGADTLAEQWAEATKTPLKIFPADWAKHGRSAGPIRNNQMLNEFKPDLLVAFPGGRGTAHMCAIALAAGVEIHWVD